MKVYVKCLHEKGILLLSGFYKEDIPMIEHEALTHNLEQKTVIERNNWVALKYLKN